MVAWALVQLIYLITNLAFYQLFALHPVSPADHHLGLAVIIIPVIGGLIIGVMARYGSKAIRGHGIPEAMEAVLENESRISVRAAIAKPLSAAIAIGTGGPFGAEGPIIVTGGALGSLLGQVLPVSRPGGEEAGAVAPAGRAVRPATAARATTASTWAPGTS